MLYKFILLDRTNNGKQKSLKNTIEQQQRQ